MSIIGNMKVIMTTPLAQRDVVRVDSPDIGRGMSDAHRVRPLVPPGDWAGAPDPGLTG
jgi:hypothetical protein